MPVNQIPNRIPRATKAKRFIHAFYLLQPILQFLVLVLMIGILTRCSPLASSTDRAGNNINNPETIFNPNNQNAQDLAEEESIRLSIKELSNENVKVIKETLFKKEAKNGLRHDARADEAAVRSIWKAHAADNTRLRRSRILTIALNNEQKETLWQTGQVRMELADYTHKFLDERGQKLFFRELKKNNENLDINASAYLVVPDASFQEDYEELELKIKVSLSVPNLEKAFLIVKLH